MRIEFTGRQTEVRRSRCVAWPSASSQKLARLLPGITRAHVVLAADKHRQVAEVSVRSPHLDLWPREASPDFGASLAAAIEKLERQAQRQWASSGSASGGRAAAAGGGGSAPPRPGAASRGAARRRAPRVAPRARRFAVKPMTLDEAALELGQAAEDGFLVFRDAATERMSVLFRRQGRPPGADRARGLMRAGAPGCASPPPERGPASRSRDLLGAGRRGT